MGYEDVRIQMADWPSKKSSFPFGQLPFYKDSDVEMPQSIAIVRHLGRKHGLYGDSLAEQAQVDVVIDTVNDGMTAVMGQFNEKFHGGDRSGVEEAIEKAMGNISKLLKDNDFFVGNKVSVADFAVFHVIDNYVKPLHAPSLAANEAIENFRKRVAALPNIAAHLASDRRPAITMPPFFKVLCTPEECK